MAEYNSKSEPFGPLIQINIEISAEMRSQRIGEYFRGYVIVTAKCGEEESTSRMMLPGPYDGPEDGELWEDFKMRYRAQLDWIRRNGTSAALTLADSLIIQAYQEDEGIGTKSAGRRLRYTKRQARLFKEMLPEYKRFWEDARRNGLINREGIWEHLVEAFEARVPYKSSQKITKPKWKSGQIALVHAALDAGVRLSNYKALGIEQWRTVKRELIDREG